MAQYVLPDGREFVMADDWYLGSCDNCGWIGSTEECPHSEEDAICPKCYLSGVDCGMIASEAKEYPSTSVGEA